MKWMPEAEAALKKVPFFVRKRVRARVETEAKAAGHRVVSLSEVKATQKRYLSGMAKEIRGYQIDACFGPSGCPNRAAEGDRLLERLTRVLEGADLLGFLRQQVKGELKFHHEFRVSIAECPNACSQPQIKDVGIIGAVMPEHGDMACTRCEACVTDCREQAILLPDETDMPVIDFTRCLACGHCVAACPTGTLTRGCRGFRIQLAGKLGRHPALARELPGIYAEDAVCEVVQACIDLYKARSQNGRRFADIFRPADFDRFAERFGNRTSCTVPPKV